MTNLQSGEGTFTGTINLGVLTYSYEDLTEKPDLLTQEETDASYATTAQGAKADSAVQPGTLSTVATSGSYADLTNKPTIPTTASQVSALPSALGSTATASVVVVAHGVAAPAGLPDGTVIVELV